MLAAITRIVHDLGVTVVLAEHRLERVVQYADRVVHLAGDGTVIAGEPAAMFATTTVAPPVVELGRALAWSPLPLSVRDARRKAEPIRARLAELVPPPRHPAAPTTSVLDARGVVVRYGDTVAVREVDLTLSPGTLTALMGRNGSGKSSLLWALQGSGRRHSGTVTVDGHDPKSLSAARARSLVGLVPQTPADLLYLDSVAAELAQAEQESGESDGLTARQLLDQITPGVPDDVHPRDLSEGQRLAVVLAIQLRARPKVLLLDEPTRGLDYQAKRALRDVRASIAAEGRAPLLE